MAPGADRKGVKTQQPILDFVRQVAEVHRAAITIGTGTAHHRQVSGTSNESAHWQGNAVDIPARGQKLVVLGQDALIAAGMSPEMARRQKGGVFNINGYQIIFNTVLKHGGDHTDHLHVGIRSK